MRILILTNNDLASLVALNIMTPKLTKYEILVGISAKVGSNQKQPAAIISLADHEQKIINDEVKLVQTYDSLTFKALSEKYRVEISEMSHINQLDGIAEVKRFDPDLILSVRFGKILQQSIIDIPRFGVINLHSGILPDYQGVMASFWAMLNGETYIGTTLHFISDKSIDTGEIIEQSKMPINTDKSYLDNVLQLYVTGCELMIAAVKTVATNQNLTCYPQQGKSAYYGFPKRQDLDQFFKLGFQLFD